MKSKEQRQREAQERDKEHKTLSAKQKITKLDLRFGANSGARKERVKLELEVIAEANSKGIAIPGAGNQRPKIKETPVFASRGEQRKWEYHQKLKNKN